ncbi:MAG: hypothetical protein ACOCTJ_03455, partial [Desulfobia sp.]
LKGKEIFVKNIITQFLIKFEAILKIVEDGKPGKENPLSGPGLFHSPTVSSPPSAGTGPFL